LFKLVFFDPLFLLQEISAQEQSHKEGMKKILRSQEGELEALQKQFDEALKSATEAGLEETQVSFTQKPARNCFISLSLWRVFFFSLIFQTPFTTVFLKLLFLKLLMSVKGACTLIRFSPSLLNNVFRFTSFSALWLSSQNFNKEKPFRIVKFSLKIAAVRHGGYFSLS